LEVKGREIYCNITKKPSLGAEETQMKLNDQMSEPEGVSFLEAVVV
jgi:hypothetical protein